MQFTTKLALLHELLTGERAAMYQELYPAAAIGAENSHLCTYPLFYNAGLGLEYSFVLQAGAHGAMGIVLDEEIEHLADTLWLVNAGISQVVTFFRSDPILRALYPDWAWMYLTQRLTEQVGDDLEQRTCMFFEYWAPNACGKPMANHHPLITTLTPDQRPYNSIAAFLGLAKNIVPIGGTVAIALPAYLVSDHSIFVKNRPNSFRACSYYGYVAEAVYDRLGIMTSDLWAGYSLEDSNHEFPGYHLSACVPGQDIPRVAPADLLVPGIVMANVAAFLLDDSLLPAAQLISRVVEEAQSHEVVREEAQHAPGEPYHFIYYHRA